MDPTPGSNSDEKPHGISCNVYGSAQRLLASVPGFSWLGAPKAGPEPPQEAPKRKCVYCGAMFAKFSFPLRPSELDVVPIMCPIHFTVGNPDRKRLKRPQDPDRICECCTIAFRLYSRFCHFTSGLEPRCDPNYLICTSSMSHSGRTVVLEADEATGKLRYVEKIATNRRDSSDSLSLLAE